MPDPDLSAIAAELQTAETDLAAAESKGHGDLSALIDKWHADSFRGTRLGNDTELWNLVRLATEDLKKRIAAHI